MISIQRILEVGSVKNYMKSFVFGIGQPSFFCRVSETVCVLIHELLTWKRGYKVVTRRIMAVRSKYSELPGIVSSFKSQSLIILPLNGNFTKLILHLDNC